jgi:hypothetical protein
MIRLTAKASDQGFVYTQVRRAPWSSQQGTALPSRIIVLIGGTWLEQAGYPPEGASTELGFTNGENYRLISALLLSMGTASADHKAGHTQNSENAPGQDRACLVTTSGGINGRVIDTKWLPRKAAEAQADNQSTFVGTHPDAQTEERCENFIQNHPQG